MIELCRLGRWCNRVGACDDEERWVEAGMSNEALLPAFGAARFPEPP